MRSRRSTTPKTWTWRRCRIGLRTTRNSPATVRRDWQAFAREAIVEGERNTELARLAGLLFRKLPGYADLVRQLVIAWNASFCQPPLNEREVEAVVASIGQYDIGPATDGGSVPP
jgi:hypothetical protein